MKYLNTFPRSGSLSCEALYLCCDLAATRAGQLRARRRFSPIVSAHALPDTRRKRDPNVSGRRIRKTLLLLATYGTSSKAPIPTPPLRSSASSTTTNTTNSIHSVFHTPPTTLSVNVRNVYPDVIDNTFLIFTDILGYIFKFPIKNRRQSEDFPAFHPQEQQ